MKKRALMVHCSYMLIICILSFTSLFGAEVKKLTKPVSSQKKVPVKNVQAKRKITVNNTIVQNDLGYYKFFMTHYPSEFNVQVNGKKLDSKEQIIIDKNRLDITYSYEWSSPLGRVKKRKTLVYDIDHTTEKIDLSFTSWKEDEPRIKAPGCSLVQVTEVEEANTIPKEKVSQFMAQASQNK